MVRLMPTCTVTGVPFTSTTVLPFKYHPNDPVENSRGSASSRASLIVIATGLAPSANCWRGSGQVVFALAPPLELWGSGRGIFPGGGGVGRQGGGGEHRN